MSLIISVEPTAKGGAFWSLAKIAAPLILPAATALVAWVWSRWHKRDVSRSGYVAQLQVLMAFIDGELSRLDNEEWTWFPALPFFAESGGPLSTAGILSTTQVNALVFVHFTYKERLAYISQYGTLGPVCDGVDRTFKIMINRDGEQYREDLEAIRAAAAPAYQALSMLAVEAGTDPRNLPRATRMQHGPQ